MNCVHNKPKCVSCEQILRKPIQEIINDWYMATARGNEELAFKAGLSKMGKDDEGNQFWIGTDKNWSDYKELEKTTMIKYRIEIEYPIANGKDDFEMTSTEMEFSSKNETIDFIRNFKDQ